MGLIILFTFIAVIIAFVSGIIVAVTDSSDNDNATFASAIAILFLIVSVSLPISATCSYVENVETKEYSSTKYSLKKKVITIEEDSTVKLDTIYTFTHK